MKIKTLATSAVLSLALVTTMVSTASASNSRFDFNRVDCTVAPLDGSQATVVTLAVLDEKGKPFANEQGVVLATATGSDFSYRFQLVSLMSDAISIFASDDQGIETFYGELDGKDKMTKGTVVNLYPASAKSENDRGSRLVSCQLLE